MTCAACYESLAYMRRPWQPSPLQVCLALDRAHADWDNLPDGGDEVCAAFDLALVVYALTLSRKVSAGWREAFEHRLSVMEFRPAPGWRTQRDVLRDVSAGRSAYFALREQVRP